MACARQNSSGGKDKLGRISRMGGELTEAVVGNQGSIRDLQGGHQCISNRRLDQVDTGKQVATTDDNGDGEQDGADCLGCDSAS